MSTNLLLILDINFALLALSYLSKYLQLFHINYSLEEKGNKLFFNCLFHKGGDHTESNVFRSDSIHV